MSSIGPYLLKYGVAGDITELSSYINNSYFSSRQKADHLLTLASQCGPNGYHVLYMCIREDDENPLGHASVIDVLVRTGRALVACTGITLGGIFVCLGGLEYNEWSIYRFMVGTALSVLPYFRAVRYTLCSSYLCKNIRAVSFIDLLFK